MTRLSTLGLLYASTGLGAAALSVSLFGAPSVALADDASDVATLRAAATLALAQIDDAAPEDLAEDLAEDATEDATEDGDYTEEDSPAPLEPDPDVEPAYEDDGAPLDEPVAPLGELLEDTSYDEYTQQSVEPDGPVYAPLTNDERRAAVRKALAEPAYAFCKSPRYGLTREDYVLCDLADDLPEECAAFAEACEAHQARAIFGKPGRGTVGGERAEPDKPIDPISAPAWLGQLMQLLTWTVIAAAIGALIFVIVKALVDRFKDKRLERPAPSGPVEESEEEDDIPIGASGAALLLAQAEEAATRGDFERAARKGHRALLHHLHEREFIELHKSRTNGDYVRRLRGKPDERGTLRDSARQVDGLEFGGYRPTLDRVRELLHRIRHLVTGAPGTTGATLLVVATLLGLSPALHGCGGSWERGRAPSETHLFRDILTQQGVSVHRRVTSIEDAPIEAGADTVLLTGNALLSRTDWDALYRWVDDGGQLWVALEYDLRPGDFPTDTLPDVDCVPHVFDWAPPRSTLRLPNAPGLKVTGEAVAVIGCRGEDSAAYMTQEPWGSGTIVTFAAPDLFTNVGIAAGDNVNTLFELVTPPDSVEWIDVVLGSGANDPISAVSAAGLSPWIIQLLILGLIFLLWRGMAFGRLRDPETQKRRAFADHARALGTQYQRSQASHFTLGHYAAWALERLRRLVRPQRVDTLHALSAAIAQRTGQREAKIMGLLVRANEARDDLTTDQNAASDPATDLGTMRELESLLEKMRGSSQ